MNFTSLTRGNVRHGGRHENSEIWYMKAPPGKKSNRKIPEYRFRRRRNSKNSSKSQKPFSENQKRLLHANTQGILLFSKRPQKYFSSRINQLVKNTNDRCLTSSAEQRYFSDSVESYRLPANQRFTEVINF